MLNERKIQEFVMFIFQLFPKYPREDGREEREYVDRGSIFYEVKFKVSLTL